MELRGTKMVTHVAVLGLTFVIVVYMLGAFVASTASASGTGSSATNAPAVPTTIVDHPPLVSIETMAVNDGKDGVLLHTYRPVEDGQAALPGCPDTITSDVGGSCFYADPSDGTQWVQLLVLNRNSLALISNTDIDCPIATTKPQEAAFDAVPTGGGACTAALSNAIASLQGGAGDLVIAVNQPGSQANQHVQPPVGVGAVLGGVGNNHGIGGPATWYNSTDHGAHLPNAVRGTVSVVGVPTWKTGGVSLESATPDKWGSGALDTSIAVDTTGLYAPLTAATADIETESPITKVLTQPATPWPAATKGQAAALSALGEKVGLGSDPRAQFYSTTTAKNTSGYWAGKVGQVANTSYSDFENPSFSSADFTWASKELRTEMSWVGAVDDYTASLAMPYKDAQSTLWAYFNSVQDAVNSSTQNGQTAEVIATVGEVLSSILEVAGGFGHATHTVAAALVGSYHMILALSTVGKAEDEPFSTEAANLALELTNRLDSTSKEIQDRWRNIIVADYGKLQTVGLCTRDMEKSCPNPKDDNEAWHISDEDENTMGQVIKLGLQRELYAKLVPVKYPEAMALNVTTPQQYDRNGGAGGWCQPLPPFAAGTGAFLNTIGGQTGYVKPIVLVNNNGENPVSQKVLDRMFSPLDKGNDYTKGGLGINEADFFNSNYHIDGAYSAPRWVDSKHYVKYTLCGWLPK